MNDMNFDGIENSSDYRRSEKMNAEISEPTREKINKLSVLAVDYLRNIVGFEKTGRDSISQLEYGFNIWKLNKEIKELIDQGYSSNPNDGVFRNKITAKTIDEHISLFEKVHDRDSKNPIEIERLIESKEARKNSSIGIFFNQIFANFSVHKNFDIYQKAIDNGEFAKRERIENKNILKQTSFTRRKRSGGNSA